MRRLLLFAAILFSFKTIAQNSDTPCNFRARPQVQQPSCAGAEDGAIRIELDNPLGLQLKFQWTKLLDVVPLPLPALLSNVATGLSSGDYQVVISNGSCSDTLTINLPEPAPLQILDTAICGIGGIINLKDRIRGGNGDYRVTASSLLGNSVDCNNCEDPVINVDKLSVLNVQITDRRGCQTQRQVAIEVLDSLKVATTVIDETCTANGAISVRASGGSGSYRYALSNTASSVQNEPTFRGLVGGRAYNVQVIDNKLCRTEQQTFVNKRAANTPVEVRKQDVTCYGARDGSIFIQPTATTSNITGYTLNALDAPPRTQPEFRNLRPDVYTVYVLEGEDCYVPYKVAINEPDSMVLTANASDANCPGESDGVVELKAEGGNSGGYQYSIDGINFQANNRFGNLSAASYPAFARDRKGCTAATAFSVSEPASPGIGTTVMASCPEENSGSIVVVEIGGWLEGEYRFSLDSIQWQSDNIFKELAPGTYTIYVQDPNGCIFTVTAIVPEVEAPGVYFKTQNPTCPESVDGSVTIEVTTNGKTMDYLYSINGEDFSTKNSFQGLSAGTYRVFLRDSLNCVFSYPFTLEQPAAPTITLQAENTTCHGGKNGSIIIQTQGGKAPFTYALNSIQFQESPVFEGLGAMSYLAIARDANGCLFAKEAQVYQPTPIQANFTIVDETCNNQNGVLVCQPSGGSAPYRYRWDVGDTTSVLTGLQAGNYRVSITDDNDCLIVAAEKVNNLPGPIVIGDLTQAPCNGMPQGAIKLTVFGGNQPFNYLWSNGMRVPQIANLHAGNYTVTVTDKNECSSIKTFNLYEPAPIAIQAQTGTSEGLWFINLICEGGAPPYRYQWSSGEITEDVFNLNPATYSVTVTDQQNCSQTLQITVGTTAVEEPAWASALKIFPNPATDQLNIHLDTPQWEATFVQLFDTYGKTVLSPTPIHQNQLVLPLTHLPKGVYWLRLQRTEEVLYRRVVVQ